MAGEAEQVREIAYQQVLEQDGAVYSVQWIVFPQKFAEALTLPMLLERYLKLIRKWTLSVIRPVVGDQGIQFRLFGSSLALLSFAPPEQVIGQEVEELRLHINGGVLVQARECNRGMFLFAVQKSHDGLRVTVQLSDFCPLLLGSRNPSMIRRLLYRFTQAYIHKVVTVRYLSHLYREITGSSCRTKLKNVRVRTGRET